MRNIIHNGQVPIREIEDLGIEGDNRIFRATIGATNSFFDEDIKTWVSTQFEDDDNLLRIRNSCICVEITRTGLVRLLDKSRKEVIENEDIALYSQEDTKPYVNTELLSDATATSIIVTDEQLGADWNIYKVLENDVAWMSIKYKIREGLGLTRDILYKYKGSEQKNLRIAIRWSNIGTDEYDDATDYSMPLTKAFLESEEVPNLILTNGEYRLNKNGELTLIEDTHEMFENSVQGNTIVEIGDTIGMTFWSAPVLGDGNTEYEIPFNTTYTNANPFRDGFVYERAQTAGSGSTSYTNVWNDNYNTNTIVWGVRYALTTGYNWGRAYVEWAIGGIPNDAIVSKVEWNTYGWITPVNPVISQVRAQSNKPSVRSTAQKHADIGAGTLLFESTTLPPYQVVTWYDLGAAAVPILQSRIASADWFAIGLKIKTETGTGDTHQASSEEHPSTSVNRLRVTYILPIRKGTEIGESEIGRSEIG